MVIGQNFVRVYGKIFREVSSQKFGVFLEKFPKTNRFIWRVSPKMYGESKGLRGTFTSSQVILFPKLFIHSSMHFFKTT